MKNSDPNHPKYYPNNINERCVGIVIIVSWVQGIKVTENYELLETCQVKYLYCSM